MVKVKYALTGKPRLDKALKMLTFAQAKGAIRTAARAAMKPMQRAVKDNAPVESGNLRRSIKVRALPRSRKRIGISVATNKRDPAFNGKSFYGGPTEHGWKVGGKNPRKIAPQHVFKRASESTKRTTMRIFRQEIIKYIRRVTGRL